MGQLLVRDLDVEIIAALKEQAARNGRSAEAEHRTILERSLLRPSRRTLADVLLEIPEVGLDEDFERLQGDDGHRRVPD